MSGPEQCKGEVGVCAIGGSMATDDRPGAGVCSKCGAVIECSECAQEASDVQGFSVNLINGQGVESIWIDLDHTTNYIDLYPKDAISLANAILREARKVIK